MDVTEHQPTDRSWSWAPWVALGAACVVAAYAIAQALTPDVPVTIENGVEYEEGGLFGNVFEKAAWFVVSIVVLLGGALAYAKVRSHNDDPFGPPASRVSLVMLGTVLGLVLTVVISSAS